MKYHVNIETGKSAICKATIKGCPLGDATPHFDSKEKAQKFIEVMEAKNNNIFNKVSKNNSDKNIKFNIKKTIIPPNELSESTVKAIELFKSNFHHYVEANGSLRNVNEFWQNNTISTFFDAYNKHMRFNGINESSVNSFIKDLEQDMNDKFYEAEKNYKYNRDLDALRIENAAGLMEDIIGSLKIILRDN